jgi:glycosyltransferase involved in cell wall biosynthesis
MPDTKISVLHFTYSEVYAGAEEHMLTLLRGLDRELFRPLLVCHPRLLQEIRTTLPEDVEVFPIRLEGLTSFGAAWQLGRILREQRVEILHSHMFHSSLLASPIGWACRVPVIIETPHVAERWRKGWMNRHFWVDRQIGRYVTHHIAVSQSNAKYLVQDKGLDPDKVITIRNGCDLARFAPGRPAPSGLRKALGFTEENLILLVPARLEPQKGHAILLKAMPDVLREFPQSKVVFVGDGSLRRDLEQQTERLGLGSTVKFVGFQSNMAEWYHFADLMVLPSFFEGLPLVAIESLAAGCPVVATAVDGTPEVIVDGETGLTVPPGEPLQLAEAICLMFRYPYIRQHLGRCGRDFVAVNFNQAKQIRETVELYRRAMSSREQWLGHRTPNAESVGGSPKEPLVARR